MITREEVNNIYKDNRKIKKIEEKLEKWIVKASTEGYDGCVLKFQSKDECYQYERIAKLHDFETSVKRIDKASEQLDILKVRDDEFYAVYELKIGW